jgi:hypothetical protein
MDLLSGKSVNQLIGEEKQMKKVVLLAAMTAFSSAPALAATETLTAVFTTPDGGVTVNQYDGIVDVTVSGVGQSAGSFFNDAFYVYDNGPPYNDPLYYQLTFGTTTLVALDPAQDAKNFLVGALPAYNSSHTYSFELDTGLVTPGHLHFGVSDGDFADNSGAFTITVASVPEASTWTMLMLGFAGLGFAAYRSRKVQPA